MRYAKSTLHTYKRRETVGRLKPDASGVVVLCEEGCGGGCGCCPTLKKGKGGNFTINDDHGNEVTLTEGQFALLQKVDLRDF